LNVRHFKEEALQKRTKSISFLARQKRMVDVNRRRIYDRM
jgi:hypothetical protein